MTQQNNAIYRFITGIIFCSLFAFNFLDGANNNEQDAYVAKKIHKVSFDQNGNSLINSLNDGFTEGIFRNSSTTYRTKFFKQLRVATMQGKGKILKTLATSLLDKDVLSKDQLVAKIITYTKHPDDSEMLLVKKSVVCHLDLKSRYILVSAEAMKYLKNNTAEKYTEFKKNYNRGLFYTLLAVLAPLSASFITNSFIKSIQSRNNFGLYSTKINTNFASCAILIALCGYGLYGHVAMKKYWHAKHMYSQAAWIQSFFMQEANFQNGLSS